MNPNERLIAYCPEIERNEMKLLMFVLLICALVGCVDPERMAEREKAFHAERQKMMEICAQQGGVPYRSFLGNIECKWKEKQ